MQTTEIARKGSESGSPPWQLTEGRAGGPEDMAVMPRSTRRAVVDRPEKWALARVGMAGAPLRLARARDGSGSAGMFRLSGEDALAFFVRAGLLRLKQE